MKYAVTLQSITTRTVIVEADSEANAVRFATTGEWDSCPTPAVLKGWEAVKVRQLNGPWMRYTGHDVRSALGIPHYILRFDRGPGRRFSWEEIFVLCERVAASGYNMASPIPVPDLGRGYAIVVPVAGLAPPTPEQVASWEAPLDAVAGDDGIATAADEVKTLDPLELQESPDVGQSGPDATGDPTVG